jgi:hypothetical protein
MHGVPEGHVLCVCEIWGSCCVLLVLVKGFRIRAVMGACSGDRGCFRFQARGVGIYRCCRRHVLRAICIHLVWVTVVVTHDPTRRNVWALAFTPQHRGDGPSQS